MKLAEPGAGFQSKVRKYNNYYIYCIDFLFLPAERQSGESRVDARGFQNNHECRYHPFLSDIAI